MEQFKKYVVDSKYNNTLKNKRHNRVWELLQPDQRALFQWMKESGLILNQQNLSLCVRGLEESRQCSSTLSNDIMRRWRSSSILENQVLSSESISTTNLGRMIVGKHAWQQEEDLKEDISIALIFHDQLFTSELFKDIQDVISLILRYRTM